ncbi:MAG: chorismate lyase [Gammaproteobacteria bacterium]|nr:chorismate lyase [Gammaproteobacteria bacterium]
MCSLRWGATLPEQPSAMHFWLQYAGSFMQRLRRYGISHPIVQVLQQSWQLPAQEERKLLSIRTRSRVLVRDVFIVSENNQWMFARSIFPRTSLTGKEKQLARLKNRSLGSVLFRHQNMHRSLFEFSEIKPGNRLHTSMMEIAERSFESLWARRSMFTLGKKSLLLTEVFLPDVFALGDSRG